MVLERCSGDYLVNYPAPVNNKSRPNNVTCRNFEDTGKRAIGKTYCWWAEKGAPDGKNMYESLITHLTVTVWQTCKQFILLMAEIRLTSG